MPPYCCTRTLNGRALKRNVAFDSFIGGRFWRRECRPLARLDETWKSPRSWTPKHVHILLLRPRGHPLCPRKFSRLPNNCSRRRVILRVQAVSHLVYTPPVSAIVVLGCLNIRDGKFQFEIKDPLCSSGPCTFCSTLSMFHN
jgi:hypothetical protein